jgi:DNA phosphorothioation-associated putative methyltransferase
VTGPTQWEAIIKERTDDLLVYLALSCFTRRPSQAELPEAIRLDIRALLGTYRTACDAADKLLFDAGRQEEISRACAASTIGKCTPEALYVHVDALTSASALVRVYEGCARAYVGSVDGANIVKMHRLKPQISYLSYPDFDSDPHPPLRESLKVRFRGLKIEYRDYRDWANPFILHRKETFIRPDHPLYSKFKRLTVQEEAKGVLGLHANQIGTQKGWQRVLESSGYELRGHRLLRRKPRDPRPTAPTPSPGDTATTVEISHH